MIVKALAAGLALTVGGAILASAEDSTTIIREHDRPAVVAPVPGVVVAPRGPTVVEKRRIETTGRGDCASKTVKREDAGGSTTVRKERCD
jgi:hypothetical protein